MRIADHKRRIQRREEILYGIKWAAEVLGGGCLFCMAIWSVVAYWVIFGY